MEKVRVLVACEKSGVVREAFRRNGHDAWSCDIEPSEDGSPFHLQQDVTPILSMGWDLLIAHPPCTFLAVSGYHWVYKDPSRLARVEKALDFVRLLLQAPIPRIALENPVSVISSRIRPPDQYIQPYQFGHDASKRTCLWLKGLPKLQPTHEVKPRMVNGRPRWGNQTDSGQNRLGPSPTRSQERSRTYEGIAQAMANLWGPLGAENRKGAPLT